MGREVEDVVFRRSLRGYNTVDVDEYIDALNRDIDSLRGELADLYKRLDAANREIAGYKNAETFRGDLLDEAQHNAEEIIKQAKNKAAHIIIKTTNQCNHIVSNMVSQVEEQKKLYEATRKEVLRFRNELFDKYTDHIKRINAFTEAAGVFERSESFDESEMEDYIASLSVDADFTKDSGLAAPFDFDEGSAADSVSEDAPEEEIMPKADLDVSVDARRAAECEDVADLDDSDEEHGAADEDKTDDDLSDDTSFGGTSGIAEITADETVIPLAETVLIPEEDLDEFEDGNGGVREFDGPVTVDAVFKDEDLDGMILPDVRSEPAVEPIAEEATVAPVEKEPEVSPASPSYGFGISHRRDEEEDDDSDEFYDGGGIDSSFEREIPASMLGSLSMDVSNGANEKKKKWTVKKSKSLTDEFDAVRSEED